MMLEQFGRIPFKDVDDIIAYVDKKLAEKISQADLAKSIKSRALRNVCIKSVRKARKEQEEKQKQGGFPCWLRSHRFIGNCKKLQGLAIF